MRKILFQIHLWMGLILSLPFLLLGISGAILVFDQDVIAKLNENPAVQASAGPVGSLDAIASAAVGSATDVRVLSIRAPKEPGAAVEVTLAPKDRPPGRGGGPNIVSVDPVTYQVLDVGQRSPEILIPVHVFHEDFMLGPIGRQIVGWSGVAMFAMGLMGLWLWWPKKGAWKRAFTIRKNARGYVFNRDLHGMAGIWLSVVFLVVSGTGAWIGLPQLRGDRGPPGFEGQAQGEGRRGGGPPGMAGGERRGGGPFAGARGQGEGRGGGPPGFGPFGGGQPTPDIKFDTALAAALKAVPDSNWRSVNAPFFGATPIRVSLATPGWSDNAPTIDVSVKAEDYSVVSVRDPRKLSGRQLVDTWVRPLHEGAGLGIVYKVLVFLSGVAIPVFAVTGLLMWLQKRKNKAVGEEESAG